jgi:hypothetical protein
VFGLGPARIAGQAAGLLEGAEAAGPAGDDLVHVRLMPGVEHDRLGRGIEHPVRGQRDLHDPEVGAQVPTGPAHLLDQERPDLGTEPP